MQLFTGLSGFPITPMTPNGQVIEADLVRLVRHIEDGGVDSVGLLGSTGGYMFLDRAQRRRAVAAAVRAARVIPVMVGVGAMRTDEAQALARDAAEEGAAGLLLAPVSYTPLSDEEVYRHFRAVASATSLPLCIYSNPTTTGFTFSPALVGRLSAIPNVCAVKLPLPSDGDLARDLAAFRKAAPRLSIGYSGDWGCKDALLAGADCWYSVAAGVFPARAVALTAAARAGRREEAERHDAAFAGLWSLFRQHGGLRTAYPAARMLGLTEAVPPRPLIDLGDELQAELVSAWPG